MSRVRIRLEGEPSTGLRARLVEPSPSDSKDLPKGIPPLLRTRQNLRTEGKRLLEQLLNHPEIAEEVGKAIVARRRDASPLLIEIGTTDAGRPSWEILWHEDAGFLALGGRWHIARVAEQKSGSVNSRHFAPPLRIMVFLAALGVDAADEWRGLHDAVRTVWDKLDIRLDIYASTQKLIDTIRKDVGDDHRVGVHGVPDNTETVLAHLNEGHPDFSGTPHIVHFFCHGESNTGVNTLLLATMEDEETGAAKPSVPVTVDQLSERLLLSKVWLMALDACGPGSQQAETLAQGLVSAGAPAVVGWREPVQAPDANTFCRHFYQTLLPLMRNALTGTAPDNYVEIEWAEAMTSPRGALSGDDPESRREWSLPLLYVRPSPFEVLIRTPEATAPPTGDGRTERALRSQQRELEEVLSTLLPDTPVALREAIAKLAKQGERSG